MSPEVERFDVIVVGYGPGAQTLAALLAKRGRRVVALERYPHLYNLPRAGHIDHEAVRIAQAVGDARSMVETMWEVRDTYVWQNQHGQVLMEQPAHSPTDAISGWFSDYTMWQPNFERVLDGGAREFGADVRLGWEVVAVEQHPDRVEVVACRNEGEPGSDRLWRSEDYVRLAAPYLVGADGANSFVRASQAIPREDLGLNEEWLVVDLETIAPLTFEPNIAQICDPRRPRLVMPLGKTHRRFEWMVLPGESTTELARPEGAWRLLEEFGVHPGNHRIARQVVYRFQARIAETWRRGRVFVSGDAAHTMPPYAGQGMLSSVRDSANLAWKLDLVLGGAPDALLDSYEVERRPNVRRWTELSIAEGAVSCELDPVRAAERDARMLAGEDMSHAAPPELDRGAFALGPDGRARRPAGTLGPQGRVRARAGEGRFDDLFGSPCFTVLTRGGAAEEVLDQAGRGLLERLAAVVVEVVAAEVEPGEGQAADLDGVYADYFEDHDAAAMVVRPDFYVFGVVADLGELPALVEELRTALGLGAGAREGSTI
ncbi:MAG: bifunctional 3-(3-hydroxy-phenyl)propionate/3-hydroxycinnamic acid hydroxylase [Solirubrobacterales bacterium]